MRIIETKTLKAWRACNELLHDMKREPATIGEFLAVYNPEHVDGDIIAFEVLNARDAVKAP
jgi:hypothetical protein